jgi:hypothetical protein
MSTPDVFQEVVAAYPQNTTEPQRASIWTADGPCPTAIAEGHKYPMAVFM